MNLLLSSRNPCRRPTADRVAADSFAFDQIHPFPASPAVVKHPRLWKVLGVRTNGYRQIDDLPQFLPQNLHFREAETGAEPPRGKASVIHRLISDPVPDPSENLLIEQDRLKRCLALHQHSVEFIGLRQFCPRIRPQSGHTRIFFRARAEPETGKAPTIGHHDFPALIGLEAQFEELGAATGFIERSLAVLAEPDGVRPDLAHPSGHAQMSKKHRLFVKFDPPIFAFSTGACHRPSAEMRRHNLAGHSLENDFIRRNFDFCELASGEDAIKYPAHGFDFWQFWHRMVVESTGWARPVVAPS